MLDMSPITLYLYEIGGVSPTSIDLSVMKGVGFVGNVLWPTQGCV